MTSVGAGVLIQARSLIFVSWQMRRKAWRSRGCSTAMVAPDLPARPVRPLRCRNDSVSLGRS